MDRMLTESDDGHGHATQPPTRLTTRSTATRSTWARCANVGQAHQRRLHPSDCHLDSGVDYSLRIWRNTWVDYAEVNGIEGYDDDGNGYGRFPRLGLHQRRQRTLMTTFQHPRGGHCARMPTTDWHCRRLLERPDHAIKVFQSTGVSSIHYCRGTFPANNGATVLNMSFGSYAESSLMLSALENAYATAALVASAGNNGIKIGPCLGCAPHFPSAYSFVLGVEDYPKGPPLGYTNWDQDGPVFTQYANLLNYEVTTPGTGILSTMRNGSYATVTRTSMSAPLMSTCVALTGEQEECKD